MTERIITVEHVRKAGLCVRGAKQWFALHGLDFNRFLTHGMPESQALALNDAFANKAVEVAREDDQ